MAEPISMQQLKDASLDVKSLEEVVNGDENVIVKTRLGETYPSIKSVLENTISKFGFVTIDSFELGATITQRNQALRHDATGRLYRWAGNLPKVVEVGSTPTSTGGTGANAWLEVSDAALKQRLASNAVGDGVDLVEGAFKKGVIQGEPAKVSDVVIQDNTNEATDRRIINIIDGYLYADSATALYRSSDMGDTWELVRNMTGRIYKMMKTSDGEVIITSGGSDIRKSTGWSQDPSTATFRNVHNMGTSANILRWGLDGDGTKFIVNHYSAIDRSLSRYVYISTDSGETWNLVWDTVARSGEQFNSASHLHAVCYDKKNDRFFNNEGHREGGVWFSDDDGLNWTLVPDSKEIFKESTPTTMTATPYGIVCGTDAYPNGVWLLKGNSLNTFKWEQSYLYRGTQSNKGTIIQCDAATVDSKTGMVYIAARGFVGQEKSVIMASNGEASGLIYEADTGSAIFNLAVADGKLIAHDANYKVIRAKIAEVGSSALNDFRYGNIATDNIIPNLSMAVGRYSNAQGDKASALGVSALAQGNESVALGNSARVYDGLGNIAVGHLATIAALSTASIAVGKSAKVDGVSRAIAIGESSTAKGNNSVALGASSQTVSSNSTALGYSATTTGGNSLSVGASTESTTNSTAVGYTAKATATGAVALGYVAKAPSAYSVAIGASSQALGASSLAIGQSALAELGNSIAIGSSSKTGLDSVAIGVGTHATGSNSVALGRSINLAGNSSVAIGASAVVTATLSTSVGYAADSSGGTATAIGSNSKAVLDSVAVGNGAKANSTKTIAIGKNATTGNVVGAVALGDESSANHAESVALGRKSTTLRDNSVCIGNRDIESTRTGGAIFLKSPNGTTHKITVGDDGVLTTVAV